MDSLSIKSIKRYHKHDIILRCFGVNKVFFSHKACPKLEIYYPLVKASNFSIEDIYRYLMTYIKFTKEFKPNPFRTKIIIYTNQVYNCIIDYLIKLHAYTSIYVVIPEELNIYYYESFKNVDSVHIVNESNYISMIRLIQVDDFIIDETVEVLDLYKF